MHFNDSHLNTLVSAKAGDEKNLHPGGANLIFLVKLIEFFK